jgi:hypothetical protein
MAPLDEFNGHASETAKFANDHDMPHELVNSKIKEERIRDGEERGWSRSRTAASMDLTERRVRQTCSEFRKQGTQSKIEKHLVNPNGCAYLDQVLEMAPANHPIPYQDILQKFHLDADKTEAILKEGIKGEYLKEVQPLVYQATGKQLIYPRSRTASDRRDRSLRASRLVRNCRDEDVWEMRCSLTAQGVERVLDFLDPPKLEAITLAKIEAREKESHSRGTGGSAPENFGVVLTFTETSNSDEELRDPIYRALIDHRNPENCVLRTSGFLDT